MKKENKNNRFDLHNEKVGHMWMLMAIEWRKQDRRKEPKNEEWLTKKQEMSWFALHCAREKKMDENWHLRFEVVACAPLHVLMMTSQPNITVNLTPTIKVYEMWVTNP